MPSYAFITAYQKYHNDWQITSELEPFCFIVVEVFLPWTLQNGVTYPITSELKWRHKHIIKTLNKGWRSMHKNSQLLIASVAEPSRWLGLFWKHQIGTFQYIYDLLHKLPGAHTQSLSFCFVIWSCYLQDGFLTAQRNLHVVSRMDMKLICGAFIRFF